MSHDEASDLLGAYALDAVDGDEFTELEEHLDTCPRCRAELDSLREVAAAMGNSVEPVPEGLWSQIALRLPERQEDEEPPPMPRLTPRGPLALPGAGPPARPAGAAPWSPPSAPSPWPPLPWRSSSASVWCGPTTRCPTCRSCRRASSSAVTAALAAPGHRVVTLDSRTHAQQAKVVVLPSGQGYLRLVDAAPAGQGPDLPAVGDRGESAHLSRPAGRFAQPGRLHHGRIDAARRT